ncbi:diguanylate cyclase [Treponema sp.]|uniref:GGDEF domain-containing protein n=1 Tax=Treponema sp. TaxID=166 RepID=UPI00388EE2E4
MNLENVQQATAFFYAGFDLFCALLMGILLYTTLTDVERTNKRLHLTHVFLAVIVYCITDIFWIFAYSDVNIQRTILTRYITNIAMYSVMSFCAYTICHFLFSIWKAVIPQKKNCRKDLLIFVPFVLTLLAILSTYWTHLIFYIDSDGNLVRGPLYALLMIILFGYVIVFGLISFVFFLRTQNDFSKEQYLLVTVYTIPVIIGASLHYFFWELPSFAIGFTIATLLIYIITMRGMVSQDALTGIFNRRQGERFFQEQIRRINEEPYSKIDCLYLFMMDLNKFKSINDTYGHTEGDKALIATAEVLKEACSHIRRKCIMSRFGGDEFVIGVVFTPEEAQLLNEKIHDLINRKNEELNAPYKISISVGFTYYKKNYNDFRTFLNNADKLMYEMKEIAHREADLEEEKLGQEN